MGSWRIWAVVAAVMLLELQVVVDAQLRYGYYDGVCPGVEDRVRTLTRRSFVADATASAAMLRLAFHDCQVGTVSLPAMAPGIACFPNPVICVLSIVDPRTSL